MEARRIKSNQIAVVLSGLLPGAGHFYIADWAKGTAFFIASITLEAYIVPEGYWDILRGEVELTLNLYVRILSLLLFRIWAVVDAERSVRQKNAEAEKS